MLKIGLFLIISTIIFTGCSNKRLAQLHSFTKQDKYNYEKKNLDNTIKTIASDLMKNVKKDKLNKKSVVFTSLVSLKNLNHTNEFGNAFSESMISELHQKGFNIVDFRGQNAIVVKENGDFYLTKELYRLKPSIDDSYVFVATYSQLDQNSIAINARIIDFDTGEVITAAKDIYITDDCSIFGICQEKKDLSVAKAKVKLKRDYN